MQTPQIYAKDLNVLELGSSGQVVMSLQDQASVSFSNDASNTITYVQGANNNAIYIQPTNSNATTVLGNFTTDSSGQWQELLTSESNGILWKRPVKLASTLDVYDRANLNATLDVCGATVLWSTLSVNDNATFSRSLSLSGDAQFGSSMNTSGAMTVSGPVKIASNLSVANTTTLKTTLDVCGTVLLRSTLSVGQAMRVTDMYASSVNVSAITSTGTISFANDVILLQGAEVFGGVTLRSSLSVYDQTTFAKALDVCGSTELWNNLSVNGTTQINSTLAVLQSVTMMSSLTVASTLSVQGSTVIQSTLDVCGSVMLKSGSQLGVQGELYASNTLELSSTLSVQGSIKLNSFIDVSGTLSARDDLIVQGTLSVKDATRFDSSMNVSEDVYMMAPTGVLNVKNAITVHDDVFVDASANILNRVFTNTNMMVDGTSIFSGVRTTVVTSSYVSTHSLYFDGSIAAKAASPDFNYVAQPFAFSAWFKANPGFQDGMLIADFRNSETSNGGGVIGFSGTIETPVIQFPGYTCPCAWSDLKWHHIVYTSDGTYSTYYVDGQYMNRLTITITAFKNLPRVTLGNRFINPTPNQVLIGFLDEVAVFNQELTGSDVTAMYGGGFPINLLTSVTNYKLVSYWKLDGNGADSKGTRPLSVSGSGTSYSTTTTATSQPVISTVTVPSLVLQNTLDICGSVIMRSSATLSVHDAVTMNTTMKVLQDVDMNSSLDVTGALMVQGATLLGSTLSVLGVSKIHSTLDVSGATRLWSTLSVYSTTTLSSTLNVFGPTKIGSTLTVSSTMNVGGMAVLGSTLSISGNVTLQTMLGVCGATIIRSTLWVEDSVDVCGNVNIGGTAIVNQNTQLNGAVVAKSTLAVLQSATFSTDIKADVYRPYTVDANKLVTIDASKVIIQGNVDVVGTINTTNNMDVMRVQDKSFTLSVDPSGGRHADGTFTNHDSGIYVAGLPSGVLTDPQQLYEKSFAWEYDTMNGASWNNLGSNSSDNSVKPLEPAWQMRGGSFKIANYRDASNGALFTMRINQAQEFEVWRSLLVDNEWQHNRVTRFGLTKTVAPVSVISAFTVALGTETRGKTVLSLRFTSVTDTLYAQKMTAPYYTVSNIKLVPQVGTAYVPSGLNFGSFYANTSGVVVSASQDVSGLTMNMMYTAVQARLTNQFGVSADLSYTLPTPMSTLDENSPVVVMSATASGSSISVTVSSYDVGVSTTSYNGVLFATTTSTYTGNTSVITTATPNTQSYAGTGKTLATADSVTRLISTDLSGNAINTSLTYYVYYVVYDPNGNRSSNPTTPVGPIAFDGVMARSTQTITTGSTNYYAGISIDDERNIVAATNGTTMYIWDDNTERVVSNVKYASLSCAISADGNTVVFIDSTNYINIFEKTSAQSWIAYDFSSVNASKRLGPYNGEWATIFLSNNGDTVSVIGYHVDSNFASSGANGSGRLFIWHRNATTWALRANTTVTTTITPPSATGDRFGQFGTAGRYGDIVIPTNINIPIGYIYYKNIGTTTWAQNSFSWTGQFPIPVCSPTGNTVGILQYTLSTITIYRTDGTTWSNVQTITITGLQGQYSGRNNSISLPSDFCMAAVTKTHWYIYEYPNPLNGTFTLSKSGVFSTPYTDFPRVNMTQDGVITVQGDGKWIQIDTGVRPLCRLIPAFRGTPPDETNTLTNGGYVKTFTGIDGKVYNLFSNWSNGGTVRTTFYNYSAMILMNAFQQQPAATGKFSIITMPVSVTVRNLFITNGEGGGLTTPPYQRAATAWRLQATNDATPWLGTPTWTTLLTVTSLPNAQVIYNLTPSQAYSSYRVIIDGFMSGTDEVNFRFGLLY
jgi:predicted acyltransferase (DUF342 family)